MLKIKRDYFKKMLFVLIVLFVGDTKLCFAQQPEDIVKEYYVADFNGSRLAARGFSAVKDLVEWHEEPGWDIAFIANNVRIVRVNKLTSNKVLVEVRYKIIGILSGDNLLSLQFDEVVEFLLVNDMKQWKIQNPKIPPHISISAASSHMRNLVSKEADKERKTILEHLIERIKHLPKEGT